VYQRQAEGDAKQAEEDIGALVARSLQKEKTAYPQAIQGCGGKNPHEQVVEYMMLKHGCVGLWLFFPPSTKVRDFGKAEHATRMLKGPSANLLRWKRSILFGSASQPMSGAFRTRNMMARIGPGIAGLRKDN
jgi:hypothetical protein